MTLPRNVVFDFYLSEMSPSNLHGRGINLQRILGEDLYGIARFIHPSRFAMDLPPIPSLQGRTAFIVNRFERDVTRRLIGCRPSNWVLSRSFVKAGHARRTAAVLAGLFPHKETLRALVFPQSQMAIWVLEALKMQRCVRYVTWMMDDHMDRARLGSIPHDPDVARRPRFQMIIDDRSRSAERGGSSLRLSQPRRRHRSSRSGGGAGIA